MAKSSGSSASKGLGGFPAGAQGTRTSWAQSGGIASSFYGARGAKTWTQPGAGANQNRIMGKNMLNSSTWYNLRSPGGDATLKKGAHGGAGKLNLPTGANPKVRGTGGPNGGKHWSKPHQLAPKGFGGGY